MWRRVIFPALLLVVFAIIAAALVKFAFFPDRQTQTLTPQSEIHSPSVDVVTGTITDTIALTGTIARDADVKIVASNNVEIRAVHVAAGQHVDAGQALLTVRQADPVATWDITAPESGTVGDFSYFTGMSLAAGGAVTTLTPDRFHLVAPVEAAQLYRLVQAPSDGSVTIAGGPAPFVCTGLTTLVADDGTTSATCAIPTDQLVFAGLPATLEMTLATAADVPLIPVTAVKGGAGSGVVWVGEGSDAQERTVTLGVSDTKNVQVIDGLQPGERILQFVPGVEVAVKEDCWTDQTGVEQCQPSSNQW